jgi:hypothetical protein
MSTAVVYQLGLHMPATVAHLRALFYVLVVHQPV